MFAQSLFGFAQPKSFSGDETALPTSQKTDSVAPAVAKSDSAAALTQSARRMRRRNTSSRKRFSTEVAAPTTDSIKPLTDSTLVTKGDSLQSVQPTVAASDTTRSRKKGGLDQIIEGKNSDSLYYDVRNKQVFIYNQGDVKYENKSLQADFMRINMDTKEVYAFGKPDTVEGVPTKTHPIFTDNGTS